MKFMKNNKLFNLTFSAVFAAIIVIFIYAIHIPNSMGGYIHVGDAIIYLCASMLPLPYAMVAVAVGGGLADLLSGYPVYIIFTIIIKAALTPFFTSKSEKIICKKNVIGTVFALIVSVSGYAVTDFLIYRFINHQPEVAFANALTTIPGNLIQGIGSAILFVAIGLALDKLKIKNKFKFRGV